MRMAFGVCTVTRSLAMWKRASSICCVLAPAWSFRSWQSRMTSVVGHVLFSPVTVEGTDGRALGLAPVGVLPQCQRRGIGTQLIREGLTRCDREGYELVVLIGAPEYYARFGFRNGRPLGLDNEYGVSDEFMVLELRKGSLEGVRGLVRYAREFAEV